MRKSVRTAALAFVLLVVAPAVFAQFTVSVPTDFSFAAYGDIRFTKPENTRVSNPTARRALVERISELKPKFLLISGDLVLAGKNRQDWDVWNRETEPLRSAGIPIFPVPGNHELVGDPKLVNYFSQFPQLQERHWYTVRAGNVLCLMIDSDADAVGGAEWQWIEQQLNEVPPEVDFLILVLHYPPYTRSVGGLLGGGHASRPAEARLAEMLQARQASLRARILLISGHVHNYERYEHEGVMYVVSGGGGATPYEVPRSADDFFRDPGPNYHWLQLHVKGRTLSVEMEKLELVNGKAGWSVRDSFELKAVPSAKAAAAR